MKAPFTHTLLSLAFLLLLSAISPAQEPDSPPSVEGIWRWTFTMPDGSQVTPRLEIREKAGLLTGITRVRAGTETAVTNLAFQGSEVRFEVARERDGQEVVTRYQGSLSSNTIKGKMISNWSGQEQSYDWEARRSIGATGTWKWSTIFGEFKVDSTLTVKQEGEKLTGKVSTPRAGESEIKHGRLRAGHISFETERERDGETFTNRFYGRLTGDKILGKIESNIFGQARTNKWEALRTD